MGMDVYGQSPTTEEGKYFRNNVWWWQPLAIYVCEIAPEIAAKCKSWHHNDGDGLNGKNSRALADALQDEIDSGRCAAYEAIRKAELDAMPNVTCDLCEGTGIRKPIPQRGAGDLKQGGIECNGCSGTGSVEPWDKHYPFSVDNVKEFIVFLRNCGGFSIC